MGSEMCIRDRPLPYRGRTSDPTLIEGEDGPTRIQGDLETPHLNRENQKPPPYIGRFGDPTLIRERRESTLIQGDLAIPAVYGEKTVRPVYREI